VRLYSRSGNDLTGRFLLIVEALRRREAEEDWGKEKWR
jgi:ATP-dependent DNA ligase